MSRRDVVVALTASKRGPLVELASIELIDCGAHLPVAVLTRLLERRVDVGAFEVGEGDDRSTPNGRLVVECGEDRFTGTIIAYGAKGGDRRLTTARILVTGCDTTELVDRSRKEMFA